MPKDPVISSVERSYRRREVSVRAFGPPPCLEQGRLSFSFIPRLEIPDHEAVGAGAARNGTVAAAIVLPFVVFWLVRMGAAGFWDPRECFK